MGPISDCSEAMMRSMTFSDVKDIRRQLAKGAGCAGWAGFCWLTCIVAAWTNHTRPDYALVLLVLVSVLYWTSRQVQGNGEQCTSVAQERHLTEGFDPSD